MSFTYDLTASGTALAVAEMRLELGDTTDGAGVRPGSANFSDEELLSFYGRNASNVLLGAAAAARANAAAYASKVSTQAGPLRKEWQQAAQAWRAQAAALEARATAGGAASIYSSFSSGFRRQDGYAYRAGTVDVAP